MLGVRMPDRFFIAGGQRHIESQSLIIGYKLQINKSKQPETRNL